MATLPGPHCAACIAYARSALEQECAELAATPEGQRNDRLNKAAFNLGQLVPGGFLGLDEVVQRLEQAAAASGLEQRETARTIMSGTTDGIQEKAARDLAEVHAQHGEPRGMVLVDPLDPLSGVVPLPAPRPSDAPGEVDPYRRALQLEIAQQRLRRLARRAIDEEEALASFREPPSLPTLAEELLIPDEDVVYRVAQVMPAGANVLLTAQYKTGKTTLVNHLTYCLADGESFLGHYNVNLMPGRVALVNYEVDPAQYRRWMRALGIRNPERVSVLNARGFTLPLITTQVQNWMVDWLVKHEVYFWVLDPFARAYVGSGTSENDNAEVSRFLDTLDVIKARANVRELLLVTHTGRGEMEEGSERARGATRLDDWCDVRWLLTADRTNSKRYFRATGRDVDTEEQELQFDPMTLQLSLSGGGNRRQAKGQALESAVLHVIEANPGIPNGQLIAAVSQILPARREQINDAIDRLRYSYRIRVEEGGIGRANRHFPVNPESVEGVS